MSYGNILKIVLRRAPLCDLFPADFFLGKILILRYNLPMDRMRILKSLIFLMFFIFLVDLAAKEFYFYFTFWWFDVIMHFLSGAWVGFFFTYVFSRKNNLPLSVLKVILWVLIVGILWEFFEVYTQNYLTGSPFNTFDTVSDIFLDLLGGFSAIYFSMKKSTPIEKNTV